MIGSGMPSSQSSAPLPKPMSVSCVLLDRRLRNRAEVPAAPENESHARAERKPAERVLGHKCPAGRMYPRATRDPRASRGLLHGLAVLPWRGRLAHDARNYALDHIGEAQTIMSGEPELVDDEQDRDDERDDHQAHDVASRSRT